MILVGMGFYFIDFQEAIDMSIANSRIVFVITISINTAYMKFLSHFFENFLGSAMRNVNTRPNFFERCFNSDQCFVNEIYPEVGTYFQVFQNIRIKNKKWQNIFTRF